MTLDRQRRVVVEVSEETHRELRRLAIFNELKLYALVEAMLRDCLHDEERVKRLIKHLKFNHS